MYYIYIYIYIYIYYVKRERRMTLYFSHVPQYILERERELGHSVFESSIEREREFWHTLFDSRDAQGPKGLAKLHVLYSALNTS